jgi:hypothetical protein
VLALAQPAEGKIVYTDTYVLLDVYYRVYHLDLNHDGETDFVLSLATGCDFSCLSDLDAQGQAGDGIEGKSQYAAALRRGAQIGPKYQFGSFKRLVQRSSYPLSRIQGPWFDATNRYLGLKFVIKGKIHYGWARMSVRFKGGHMEGMLTGYAYETIANKAIIAGRTKGPDVTAAQPTSLGHLAAGASAIPAWRGAGGNQ